MRTKIQLERAASYVLLYAEYEEFVNRAFWQGILACTAHPPCSNPLVH